VRAFLRPAGVPNPFAENPSITFVSLSSALSVTFFVSQFDNAIT